MIPDFMLSVIPDFRQVRFSVILDFRISVIPDFMLSVIPDFRQVRISVTIPLSRKLGTSAMCMKL